MRAGLGHPDQIVRLATGLAAISIALGVASVIPQLGAWLRVGSAGLGRMLSLVARLGELAATGLDMMGMAGAMKWYLGKASAVLGLGLLTWSNLSRAQRTVVPPHVETGTWREPRYQPAVEAPNYWFWAKLGAGFVASLASIVFF